MSPSARTLLFALGLLTGEATKIPSQQPTSFRSHSWLSEYGNTTLSLFERELSELVAEAQERLGEIAEYQDEGDATARGGGEGKAGAGAEAKDAHARAYAVINSLQTRTRIK